MRKQIKLDSLPEVLILQLGRFSFDYHKNIPIKVRAGAVWSTRSYILYKIRFLLRFLTAQIQNNVEYPAKLELPVACLSDELKTRLTSKNFAVSSFDHLLSQLHILI